jgi:3-hydroxybutyryl-CoA dehydrogenase
MPPSEQRQADPAESTVVVGGGVMGQDARLFAGGIAVTVVERGRARIPSDVTMARALRRTRSPTSSSRAARGSRREAWLAREVEARYRGRPVLATNTSGLPLDELAEPLSYPHRFLAMHFFMPADVFPMIEVVRGARTEDAAVAVALAAVTRAGREPILLQRAVNGYLINRLQHSILHEAYHLIEDGIATPEMIDQVAKRLLGPRMCITGLIEQKDIAGLGMHAQAQRSIVPSLSHTNVPSPYLQKMVARGDVGIAAARLTNAGATRGRGGRGPGSAVARLPRGRGREIFVAAQKRAPEGPPHGGDPVLAAGLRAFACVDGYSGEITSDHRHDVGKPTTAIG